MVRFLFTTALLCMLDIWKHAQSLKTLPNLYITLNTTSFSVTGCESPQPRSYKKSSHNTTSCLVSGDGVASSWRNAKLRREFSREQQHMTEEQSPLEPRHSTRFGSSLLSNRKYLVNTVSHIRNIPHTGKWVFLYLVIALWRYCQNQHYGWLIIVRYTMVELNMGYTIYWRLLLYSTSSKKSRVDNKLR